MSKRKANTDIAYCTKNECKEKCWRHVSNWDFEASGYYSFTSGVNDCQDEDFGEMEEE